MCLPTQESALPAVLGRACEDRLPEREVTRKSEEDEERLSTFRRCLLQDLEPSCRRPPLSCPRVLWRLIVNSRSWQNGLRSTRALTLFDSGLEVKDIFRDTFQRWTLQESLLEQLRRREATSPCSSAVSWPGGSSPSRVAPAFIHTESFRL